MDGRIVGSWAQDKRCRLDLHHFEWVDAVRRREVDERAADLTSMVGGTRFAIRSR